MKKLEENYACQNMNFYFMMGSDLIPGLVNWDNGKELIDEINFTVFERKGYESVLDETI